MSNEHYGFDTGIKCPNCEEDMMRSIEGCKRECPHCGYVEPNEPITKTVTKDQLHA